MELTARLSSVSALLRSAWNTLKSKKNVLIPIAAIPALIGAIPSLINIFTDRANVNTQALSLILTLVFALLGVIASIASGVALISVISGQSATVSEGYRRGFSMFFPYLWIYILVVIAWTGGSIFFIVPGIIVAVFTLFYAFILTVENIRGIKALSRSSWYVSGYWWPVFGRALALFLIFIPIVLLVFGSVFVGGPYLFAILSVILNILLPLFAFIYFYHLYSDLKTIKATVPADRKSGLSPLVIKGFITLGVVALLGYVYLGFIAGPKISELEDANFDDEYPLDQKAFEEAIRKAIEEQDKLNQ